MSLLRKLIKGQFAMLISLGGIFIASVVLAAAAGSTVGGSTAQFAVAYPYVMISMMALLVALLVFLVGIIGYFLRKDRAELAQQIAAANNNFTRAEASIKEAAGKADQSIKEVTADIKHTMDTLFEHHYLLSASVNTIDKVVAGIQATCKLRGTLCPIGHIDCLDRRNDMLPPRRHGLEDRRDDEDQEEASRSHSIHLEEPHQ